MTNSFTAFALAPGALNTGTAKSDNFSRGILLTPVPALPTALSEEGISIERISKDLRIIASGSNIFSSTMYVSSGKDSMPSLAILLSLSILYIFYIISFKVLHKGDQFLNTFNWHGIVHACPHTSNSSVTFEIH